MNRVMQPVGLLMLSGLLGGCAALMVPPEEDPLYLRMNELDARVERVERVIQNDSLMEMLRQLQSLQQDTQSLRNDVETLQHEMGQAGDRQRQLYLDLDQRLQGLEKSTAQLGSSELSVLEGGNLGPGQLPVPGGTDRANYQAAFELLKQGRYDQANIALKQFMVAFPKSPLADNGQYWLAETYYVTQKYRKALEEFQKVVEKYPDSRKIPDALLKIGYCNYELKRWDAARTSLASVARDYPETTAARLANQRIERLAQEGH